MGSSFKYNISGDIFEFQKENPKEPTQRYLDIRAKGDQIKIHSTPSNADFNVYIKEVVA